MARVRELATLSASPASGRDPLFLDTAARPRVRSRNRDRRCGFDARLIPTAGKRARSISRRTGTSGAPGAAATAHTAPASLATECGPRYESLMNELDSFQARRRCRSRGAAARGARRRRSRDTRSSNAAPARSISSTCCCARAICWWIMRQVRRAFQSRFTHLFVDEFQDTDPLQAEILLLLAADDPAERDWRRITPGARKAVSRRRSRSRPSTASAAPTSRRIKRSATCSNRAGRSAPTCTRASARRPRSSTS